MPPALLTAMESVIATLTQILPVSAGGHAALLGLLFDLTVDERYRVPFSAALCLPCGLFFRAPVVTMVREGVRGVMRPRELLLTQGGRDAITVAVASVALVGAELGVREHAATWGREPALVGGSLLLTAAVLGSTFWARAGERDTPTAWGAFLVGAVQGVAVLPGLSRPAFASATLLWLGVRSERAFELCFLMALPMSTVALARTVLRWPNPEQLPDAPSCAVALVAGLLAGLASLGALRAVLRRHALPAFSLYLVPLALATLAWGYARP